jgi:nitrite reductase/ring-hydroxylating ferredoxin subunit
MVQMDDSVRAEFQALAHEADEIADQVETALEEHAAFSLQIETRRKVESLASRYRELCAPLDEKDRFTIDRGPGRRVSDLQKLATRLPHPPQGKPAEKASDTGFFETRAPKSSRPPVNPGLQPGETLRRDRTLVRVTDEIDAWCGRCSMVRSHIIAAVVENEPAQVVCQVCGARSRYREGPVKKKDGDDKPRKSALAPTAADRAKDVKNEEKNALLAELKGADNVRSFSPKERYKAGEIIEHPEHGRGKIENTLPRSLLVRFASGLKPLKLG